MATEGGIEQMSREECLELMGAQSIGRLGVVVDGFPLVLPMNFALDGDTVVLQTNEGAKYCSAPMTAVSFEVDQVDFDAGVGWSVLVSGYAEDISGSIDERSEHQRRLVTHSWAPPPADRWLKIVPRQISGRRLRARREGDPAS